MSQLNLTMTFQFYLATHNFFTLGIIITFAMLNMAYPQNNKAVCVRYRESFNTFGSGLKNSVYYHIVYEDQIVAAHAAVLEISVARIDAKMEHL